MKNWIYGLLAIAVVATACQKDEVVEPVVTPTATTLTISIENDLTASRTEFGESDGSQIEIVWSANDEVTLYNQNYEFVGTATLTAGGGTAEGTFSTEADLTNVTKLYVLHGQDVSMDATNFYYTMPASQAYVNGNIDGTILPQFGTSEGNTLTNIVLMNLATVLRFDLTPDASTTISSIAVGKVKEPISGQMKVAWSNPANKATAVDSGTDYKVEVKCMVGENKTSGAVIAGGAVNSFYMVLPYVADELTGTRGDGSLIVQVAYAAEDAESEITKKPLAAPSLSVARSTVHPISLTLTDVPNSLAAAQAAFGTINVQATSNYIKKLIQKLEVEPTKITFVANQSYEEGLTVLEGTKDAPIVMGKVENEDEVTLYTPYSAFAFSGNCEKMFAGMLKLIEIDFNNAVNTDGITNMNRMFQGDKLLQRINFGTNFSTSKVENMFQMFYNCYSLVGELDLTSFQLEKVTDMSEMFKMEDATPNTTLTSIKFNPSTSTPELTTISYMFQNCAGLQSVDLRGISTEKVEAMAMTFNGCTALNTIQLDPAKFKGEVVEDMEGIFTDCKALQTIDGFGGFVGSKIIVDYASMFANMNNLTSLDLSSWNPAAATSFQSMFEGCNALQSITFGENFDSNKVETMQNMFKYCYNLTSLDLSHFDSGALLNTHSMFEACQKLSTLTLGSDFTLQKVTDLSYMFQLCLALQTIDLTYFDTDSAVDMSSMFGCDGDTELEEDESVALSSIIFGSNFNTSNVTAMRYMFGKCSNVKSLNLETFDLSNLDVEESAYMVGGLRNCYIRLTQDAYNKIAQTDGFNKDRNTYIIAGTQN